MTTSMPVPDTSMNLSAPSVQGNDAMHSCGLLPARIGASMEHRLGIDMPLERPNYPVARGARIALAAKAGSKVYLVVLPLSSHPEHPEFRRWICKHPECRGHRWATRDELVAAHPSNNELKRTGQGHIFLCVLEVPAEGPRPASVHLLSESWRAAEPAAPPPNADSWDYRHQEQR
jgi:hypothetical protein